MTKTIEQLWKDLKKQKKSQTGRKAQDMITRPALIRKVCSVLGDEGYVVYPRDAWECMGHSPISDFDDQIVDLISMDDIKKFNSVEELKEHIIFLAGAVHDFQVLAGAVHDLHALKPVAECEKLAEGLANAFLGCIPGAPTVLPVLPPKELVKGVATYVVMHEKKTAELRRMASLNVAGEGVKVKGDYRDIPMSVKELGTIDGLGADSYLDPYYFPYGGNLELSLQQCLRRTFEAWLKTIPARCL